MQIVYLNTDATGPYYAIYGMARGLRLKAHEEVGGVEPGIDSTDHKAKFSRMCNFFRILGVFGFAVMLHLFFQPHLRMGNFTLCTIMVMFILLKNDKKDG